MKHNIIKTDNYLLVVDDSEIKVEEWFYNPNFNEIGINHNPCGCKKIIAHLPLNNSPILEGVSLLPPLDVEDDVEKMAKNATKIYVNEREKQTVYLEFINGYNKAREKYKFTEEDMEIMFHCGRTYQGREGDTSFEEKLKTISQPKTPTHFDFEMRDYGHYEIGVDDFIKFGEKPKTTTNPQGQTQVVGRYIYE